MEEETVTITKKEYEQLLWVQACLDILLARGVDNWEGYCTPPDRDDFDTEEEWEVALERAYSGW